MNKVITYKQTSQNQKNKNKNKQNKKNRRLLFTLLKKAHHNFLAEDRLDIPRKEVTIKPVYYYSAAIVMVVLIVSGVYISFIAPKNEFNTEKIYNSYYTPYVLDKNSFTKASEDDDLRIAILSYENRKYALACELFERAIEKNNNLEEAIFYRGVSCMETGQDKQSIESFKTILQNENNKYFAAAHWYTALTWIKLNNPKSAISHLQWLYSNNPTYKSKAAEILVRMDK